LYRQFFINTNKITSLPLILTNSPQNQLINELKNVFLFSNISNKNHKYDKIQHVNSLNNFNNYLIKFMSLTNNFISNHYMFNQTYLTFFNKINFNENNALNHNNSLFKNQYRPLRKGVNNMLRLHATGAIAMPIEIRLQILASSKDVIHS
jgi:hypothetical protein